MSTDTETPSKDDFLKQIWSVCTTLTEEAMGIASAKAKEAGFDPNRGLVSLPESFINLSSARAILEDAIEKEKLVQLPITVQKELLANLEAISKALQGLTNGVDEVVNLTSAIETLNTSIWKYGLHNLSDQVLGYQKKLNQLKNHELQISKAIAQLDLAQKTADKVGAAAGEVEKKKSEADILLEHVKQSTSASAALLQQITDANTQVSTLLASVQQHEKQSGELTSSIKTTNNELSSLDTSIRKFYEEVDEYRKKIAQASDDASKLITSSEAALNKLTGDTTTKVADTIESLQAAAAKETDELTATIQTKSREADETLSNLESSTKANITTFQTGVEGSLSEALEQAGKSSAKLIVDSEQKLKTLETGLAARSEETIEANRKETEKLVDELTVLKEEVKAQIQQATGFALFGAFQSRQNQIVGSKKIWAIAIAVLVGVSIVVTSLIAYEAKFYNAHDFAFWIKLSLTIPLGYAIAFCTLQYSRERRLEEEYAFKASISVSLTPYRELVHSILEKDGTIDQSKYTDFVIDSVKNVFTSPTDRVFEGDKKEGVSFKVLKQTAEVLGTAVKATK
jgi:chromosome segregation ATPase